MPHDDPRTHLPGRAGPVRVYWAEVLGALADAGARFLVVGAHAMAVHGVPRGTQDLDVWIDLAAENSERRKDLVDLEAPGELPPA